MPPGRTAGSLPHRARGPSLHLRGRGGQRLSGGAPTLYPPGRWAGSPAARWASGGVRGRSECGAAGRATPRRWEAPQATLSSGTEASALGLWGRGSQTHCQLHPRGQPPTCGGTCKPTREMHKSCVRVCVSEHVSVCENESVTTWADNCVRARSVSVCAQLNR